MSRYIDADLISYEQRERLGLGIDYGTTEKSTYEIAYKSAIERIPTADVEEVRHGEWIFIPETLITCAVFECSVCKCYQLDPHTKSNMQFCPRCGAKMDGGKK